MIDDTLEEVISGTSLRPAHLRRYVYIAEPVPVLSDPVMSNHMFRRLEARYLGQV